MRDVPLILRLCALRHWRLAWRQQVMLLAILALGTAVHVAMRLANRSALDGFQRFTDTMTQGSDWTLRPAAGSMRIEWLREMRDALDARPTTLIPIIDATVVPHVENGAASVSDRPTWRLTGIDVVALHQLLPHEAGIRTRAISDDTTEAVMVGEAMAKRLGWSRGSRVKLVVNDRVVEVRIGAVLHALPDKPAPPDDWLMLDLPRAQAVLGREGGMDRVEVLAADGPAFPHHREEAREVLERVSKGRWQVLDHEDRRETASQMTAAFRLNLTVLSLLALLVGGCLMFQALDGVVIRRREEIAILRSLGVTERGIRRAFLAEAALLGLLAGILGVSIGWIGAQAAVRGVAGTMTALYGASSARLAELHASEAAAGVLLCVFTSLCAAWWPARQAARLPPAAALGRHAVPWQGGRWWRAERAGFVLAGIAISLASFDELRIGTQRIPLAAYGSALFWLLGAGLSAGVLLRAIGALSKRVCSAEMNVGLSHLKRPTVRHRFAVAALTSAVTMTCGMAVMIGSFDRTMRGWITRSMKADIYLASAGAKSASSTHQIGAETVEEVRALPAIAEMATLQHTIVQRGDGPLHVLGSEPEFTTKHDLHAWVSGPPKQWWLAGRPTAVINESLATRLRLRVGDELSLPVADGTETVSIAGIYADYGNEQGSVTVPQRWFRPWYQSDSAWRIALMLKPGANAESVRATLQAAYPGLSVFTQGHLRSEALRIFRQTFAVTYALQAVGVVVAVAGLGLALASLMLDRAGDLSTLRAIGFTRKQIAAACACEGFGLASAGAGAGVAGGLWMGWLLIARVNKQCFGWTLSFHLPWLQIVSFAIAVVITGAFVAAWVGRWSARLKAEPEE